MNDAIGGYFELELKKGTEYHQKAKHLNTSRNAFEYVLRCKKIKRVFVPRYMCNSMLQPLERLGISYAFYDLDEKLRPLIDDTIDHDEALLVVNYFGILNTTIKQIVSNNPTSIIDNSQAFFTEPISGIETIYSARKFFGVPDGAYLYSGCSIDVELQRDTSYIYCDFLLKRIDLSPEEGYSSFRSNEERLDNNPIRRMSKLTQALLSSIDYEFARKRRNENFFFLHENLRDKNELTDLIENEAIDGPMVYPFMTKDPSLREKLHKNRIYVATYWNDVFERTDENSLEWQLTKYMIPLPIDQRYGNSDMIQVLNTIY